MSKFLMLPVHMIECVVHHRRRTCDAHNVDQYLIFKLVVALQYEVDQSSSYFINGLP